MRPTSDAVASTLLREGVGHRTPKVALAALAVLEAIGAGSGPTALPLSPVEAALPSALAHPSNEVRRAVIALCRALVAAGGTGR